MREEKEEEEEKKRFFLVASAFARNRNRRPQALPLLSRTWQVASTLSLSSLGAGATPSSRGAHSKPMGSSGAPLRL